MINWLERHDMMLPVGIVAVSASVILLLAGLLTAQAVFCDYWNGTARATLIEKQTGIKYTWREAAQIKTMYDQQNVRIVFEEEKREKK